MTRAATLIPWLLSVWTLGAMYAAGGRPRLGWGLALAGQPLWFAYSWAADAWGFVPLNVGLTIVYAWNLIRADWRWTLLVQHYRIARRYQSPHMAAWIAWRFTSQLRRA